jgi:transposase
MRALALLNLIINQQLLRLIHRDHPEGRCRILACVPDHDLRSSLCLDGINTGAGSALPAAFRDKLQSNAATSIEISRTWKRDKLIVVEVSDDLRERVWRACHDEAMGPSEAAEELGVSRSFVCKLMRRYRDEGTLSAKPRGGNRPPAVGATDLAALRGLVRERPDATLAELCRLLDERRGIKVRTWTMCRALARLELPPKKSPSTAASGTRLVFVACVGLTPAN